ncbi:hypothetical protein ES288_A11G096500v1 [Gossypium darwinii]|uniref:Ubiquitin-related modifier 1 n=1 Tax=Gossypium darwinii TaxID=34276 RepID=A0A5D2EJF9_GOSDA|nr:hypothetical protein ES288_A11G096500v1 [Gossypium darwinii]
MVHRKSVYALYCNRHLVKSRLGFLEFLQNLFKMHLTLEFGGGLELLCESVKIHNVNVDLPKGADKLSMRDLLAWVRTNLIKERPESSHLTECGLWLMQETWCSCPCK